MRKKINPQVEEQHISICTFLEACQHYFKLGISYLIKQLGPGDLATQMSGGEGWKMVFTLIKVVSTRELCLRQKYYPVPAHSKASTVLLNASKLTAVNSYLSSCDECKGGKQQRTQFQHQEINRSLGRNSVSNSPQYSLYCLSTRKTKTTSGCDNSFRRLGYPWELLKQVMMGFEVIARSGDSAVLA